MKFLETNEFKVLALIILLGLGLRLAGSALFPVGSGSEEGSHLFYVEFIGDNGKLPMVPLTQETLTNISNESISQPPLFYFIAAVFYQAVSGQSSSLIVHFLRLLSVAFGVICIPLTYLIAKKLEFNRIVRIGSAMFIALLPTHIVTSSTLSNSTLSWVFCLGVIYYSIKVLQEKKAIDMALAGILMAATALTMFTGLGVAIAFGIAWIAFILKGREQYWKKIVACSTPLLGAVVLVRNITISNSLMPSLLKPMMKLDLDWLIYYISRLFPGIWLQEYGTATIPDIRYAFFGFYSLISFAGLVGFLRLLSGKKWSTQRKKIIIIALAAPIVLNLIGVTYINFFGRWAEARWLFATISLAGILLIAGLVSFAEMLGQTARAKLLVWAFLLSLLLFDLVLLLNYNPVLQDIIWNVPVF